MDEVLLFCKENNIGIRKFLSKNYNVNYEKRKGKNKIKHGDITSLPNLVKVPISFSERYKDLVFDGELIIVRDDFGRYESYINPNQIKDIELEQSIRDNIKILQTKKDENSNLTRINLEKSLCKIERTKRIMEFFTQTVNNKKGR